MNPERRLIETTANLNPCTSSSTTSRPACCRHGGRTSVFAGVGQDLQVVHEEPQASAGNAARVDVTSTKAPASKELDFNMPQTLKEDSMPRCSPVRSRGQYPSLPFFPNTTQQRPSSVDNQRRIRSLRSIRHRRLMPFLLALQTRLTAHRIQTQLSRQEHSEGVQTRPRRLLQLH